MIRKADIFEKLKFVDNRFNELGDKVMNGGLKGQPIEFVKRPMITLRRTFLTPSSHCICLRENEIRLGKKCFFPLYKEQLIKRPFNDLKKYHHQLYQKLFSIAAAVQKNDIYPDTLFSYGGIKQLFDMVNGKKHDRLIAIAPDKSGAIYVDTGSMKMTFPISSQIGISHIKVPAGSLHNKGENFVFESNGEEVMLFCMKIKNLTFRLMQDLYLVAE